MTECRDTETQREDLRAALRLVAFTDHSSLARATSDNDTGAVIVRWLLKLSRLPEFRLAIRLAQDSSAIEDVEREVAVRGGTAAGSTG